MQRLLGQKTGSCFQRCVGMDAINALYSVTYESDQARGTDYHERFKEYVRYLQDNDLVVDGAMTDPKGDRSLPPHQQPDPDVYVHVVERRDDGIVVRGAKAHQTGACNSHEIVVMPTVAMREGDEDFAVCFSCPANAEGVYYIYGRQSCDTRKLEESRPRRGQHALRRPGGADGLRRRVRALGARLHVRRDRVLRRARGALRRLSPAELRRLQGRRRRRAHRRRRPGRRLQRRRQGQPHQGQDHRDDAPQRDAVLLRPGLLLRGRADAGRQLPDRHAAGQRVQAERDPLPLRDRASGRGHRRRAHGHHAVGAGPRRREARPHRGEVPGRPVRHADHRPHARAAPHREPDDRRRRPSATAPSPCTAPARRRRSAS